MKYLIPLIILISTRGVCQQEDPSKFHPIHTPDQYFLPGTILAWASSSLDQKQSSFQVYLSFSSIYGEYNSNWTLQKEPNIWAITQEYTYYYGISNSIMVAFNLPVITQFSEGKSTTHLEDTQIWLGYQISNDTSNSWVPDSRLIFVQTFPTGNYTGLNPDKLVIDQTGEGAFQSGFTFVASKSIKISDQVLNLTGSLTYAYPFSTEVKGFNAYGGGYETKGTAKPGQSINILISPQYTLNRKWTLGLDSSFTFQAPSAFSGKKGFDKDGFTAINTLPTSYQLSLAPQVEYMPAPQMGLQWGIYFTFAGKNSPAFCSAIGLYYINF